MNDIPPRALTKPECLKLYTSESQTCAVDSPQQTTIYRGENHHLVQQNMYVQYLESNSDRKFTGKVYGNLLALGKLILLLVLES